MVEALIPIHFREKEKEKHSGHRGGRSSSHCSAGPQWLLSADSSKAVDVMSVVHFWVSEQGAILRH